MEGEVLSVSWRESDPSIFFFFKAGKLKALLGFPVCLALWGYMFSESETVRNLLYPSDPFPSLSYWFCLLCVVRSCFRFSIPRVSAWFGSLLLFTHITAEMCCRFSCPQSAVCLSAARVVFFTCPRDWLLLVFLKGLSASALSTYRIFSAKYPEWSF